MSEPKVIWSGTYAGIDADVRIMNGKPVPFLAGRVATWERDITSIFEAAVMGLAVERDELPDDVMKFVQEVEARIDGLASGKAYSPSDPESIASMREYSRRFSDWQEHAPGDQRMLIVIVREQGARMVRLESEIEAMRERLAKLNTLLENTDECPTRPFPGCVCCGDLAEIKERVW